VHPCYPESLSSRCEICFVCTDLVPSFESFLVLDPCFDKHFLGQALTASFSNRSNVRVVVVRADQTVVIGLAADSGI
jgi:hypothetical protein